MKIFKDAFSVDREVGAGDKVIYLHLRAIENSYGNGTVEPGEIIEDAVDRLSIVDNWLVRECLGGSCQH